MTLRRPQLRVLAVLADGPAKQSNTTDAKARTVCWRTVRALERAGLTIDVAGHSAILTDRGRQVAADPPAPPPFKYDHGTQACYTIDGCDCLPCRHAASEYEARRRRDQAYGRPRLVDAEPVRRHVRSLMASRVGTADGVGLKQIAKVSGVPSGTLWKLMYGTPERGPSKTVRTATAEKLLAVTAADMADGATVPAGTTRQRLRDLRTAGATWAELGEQVGMHPSNVCGVMRRKHVTVRTARAVFSLWERWKSGAWAPRGKRSRWEVDRA